MSLSLAGGFWSCLGLLTPLLLKHCVAYRDEQVNAILG